MAQQAFPITRFQFANTQPVANGYLLVNLSKDCMSSTGQMSAGVKTKVPLDVTGQVINGPVFWPNSALTPNDVLYIYSVYTAEGHRVLGPLSITIGMAASEGFGQAFGTQFAS